MALQSHYQSPRTHSSQVKVLCLQAWGYPPSRIRWTGSTPSLENDMVKKREILILTHMQSFVLELGNKQLTVWLWFLLVFRFPKYILGNFFLILWEESFWWRRRKCGGGGGGQTLILKKKKNRASCRKSISSAGCSPYVPWKSASVSDIHSFWALNIFFISEQLQFSPCLRE